MRAALGVLLALGLAAPAQAQAVTRLPRAAFDVIAPAERVAGRPGEMRVVQPGCRVGPTAWARRRIVDIAVQEWAVFGFQTVDATAVETRRLPDGVVAEAVNPPLPAPRQARPLVRLGRWESDPRTAPTVAGYWSATPDGARILARQNARWREAGTEVEWVEPWSAAFISWVMCEAGLGEPAQFRRDIAHRVYIDQAIRARDGQAPDAAYAAHDAGEVPLRPGDLVCNARGSAGYRSLADRRPEMDGHAPTHCDVVVRVAPDRIAVIGGNVSNSVTLTILPLTGQGTAHPRPVSGDDLDGARTVFAHLSLRADPVEDAAMDASPTIRALAAPR